MAAVSLLDSLASTSNISLYQTPETGFTPTEGDLLVVFAAVSGSLTDPASCTASANGITFTQVQSNQADAASDMLYIFVADQKVGASPAAMYVGVDVGTDAGVGAVVIVLAVSGMSKVGTAAVKQATGTQRNASATPEITFAANITAGNPVIGAASCNVNPAAITEPSGWTELVDTGIGSPNWGYELAKIDSHSGSTTTVTWGGVVSTRGGTHAIELDASSAGTPVSDAFIAKWDVRFKASDSFIPKWNVIAKISDAFVAKWDVRSKLSDTFIAQWGVREKLTDALILKWYVRAKAQDTFTAIYGVGGRISDALTALWNVRSKLTDSSTLRWEVRTKLIDAFTPRWSVRAKISDAFVGRWNVRAKLSDAFTSLWNVATSGATQVTDALIARWNVSAKTIDVFSAQWGVRTKLTDALALRWGVRQRAGRIADITPVYNLTFDTDISGWGEVGSGTVEWDNGELKKVKGVLNDDYAFCDFTLAPVVVASSRFMVSFDARADRNLNIYLAVYGPSMVVSKYFPVGTSKQRINFNSKENDGNINFTDTTINYLEFGFNSTGGAQPAGATYWIDNIVITEYAPKLNTYIWNVKKRTTDALKLLWNQKAKVYSTDQAGNAHLQSYWHVKRKQSDSVTLRWGVRTKLAAGKVNTYRWVVKKKVTDSLKALFSLSRGVTPWGEQPSDLQSYSQVPNDTQTYTEVPKQNTPWT